MQKFLKSRFLWETMCLVLIISISAIRAQADNAVGLGMTCRGQHDTIYADRAATVDIYMENDFQLNGMCLSFKFFSTDGVTWQWSNDIPDNGFYSFNPDSRIQNGSVFDFPLYPSIGTPIIYDGDGISPDTIFWGGLAMMQGLPPGPLEYMLSYHFSANISDPDSVYTFCVDSTFVPPSGAFTFVDVMGVVWTPNVLWESGGACWPVKTAPEVCGDVNDDGSFNVGDPVFLVAFIFKGGTEPPSMRLGDANGDGAVNVGDAVYMLNTIFKFGPDPICP